MRVADPSEPVSLRPGASCLRWRAEGSRSEPLPLLRYRFTQRIAAWSEVGLDAAALLFFPLLVVLPRGIAALVSAAGLCAAGFGAVGKRSKAEPAAFLIATMLLGCLLLVGDHFDLVVGRSRAQFGRGGPTRRSVCSSG